MHGQTKQLKEKRNPAGSHSAHYAKHEYCGKNKSVQKLLAFRDFPKKRFRIKISFFNSFCMPMDATFRNLSKFAYFSYRIFNRT